MRYLLIDTSTSVLNIGIIEDNKIEYFYTEKIENNMASKVLPVIKKGFDDLKFDINDIDKIFVVNGPGSFTGVRIGVTIAKIIAYSLNKEVIPLSSLELLATTSVNTKYIIPMIDARRGNAFASIYDEDLNNVVADGLYEINSFLEDCKEDYTVVSNDIFNFDTILPKIDLLKIINKHKNEKGVNPHSINPNYLKKTQAEENKDR